MVRSYGEGPFLGDWFGVAVAYAPARLLECWLKKNLLERLNTIDFPSSQRFCGSPADKVSGCRE